MTVSLISAVCGQSVRQVWISKVTYPLFFCLSPRTAEIPLNACSLSTDVSRGRANDRMFLFVNGRPANDGSIERAITQCFRTHSLAASEYFFISFPPPATPFSRSSQLTSLHPSIRRPLVDCDRVDAAGRYPFAVLEIHVPRVGHFLHC
jgi:hypothetical protein